MTIVGVETTKNIFTYPLTGLGIFMVYRRSTNTISVFSHTNGKLLKTIELCDEDKDLTFDDFVIGARIFHLDIINSFQ
jgi:hypothetical protein